MKDPKLNDNLYKNLMDKYKTKLDKSLGGDSASNFKAHEDINNFNAPDKVNSLEYESFKEEYTPTHMSLYENACNVAEGILKIKPDSKKEKEIKEAIDICHLNITPTGATSLAILIPAFFIIFGSFFGYIIPNTFFPRPDGSQEMFFTVFSIFVGVILYPILNNIPFYMAKNWRLKASNQMVLCVFYIVTYMRHTSNLENAIEFASEHLSSPLSLDMKRILWDVETSKYESVKESLDVYLDSWKKYNMEFIEAMHLIESSLYETSEDRRINSLDKAISVMLDETYDKMLHYAHGLQSPLMMLNMMGIILPILGLVILPLAVSFLDAIKWYHLAMIYDVALPIGVFYLGSMILSSRPTGYGASDIDDNVEIKKFKNLIINFGNQELRIPPLFVSLFIGSILIIIGISPLVIHTMNPDPDFDMPLWGQDREGQGGYWLLGYKPNKYDASIYDGPFGFGAGLISFAITLGIGLSIGLYFKFRSDNVIKIRDETKKLELEFASALFQLGNRLGDGLPPEIAFSKVAEVMEGTISGQFFNEVTLRITKLGMSVEQAIFDKQHGALTLYPSSLIESSMKVFLESSKKGPRVASNALINVSEYIKEIHKVNERLKDLLAEVISSMKSQISFLTPVISGIVIGITSMITAILINLGEQFKKVGTGDQTASAMGGMTEFFGNGIPSYYFQIIVGIYVIEIVFILTILTNGIENGSDKLNERYMLGKNLIKSTILYCLIAIAISFAFNMVASSIMGSLSLG